MVDGSTWAAVNIGVISYIMTTQVRDLSNHTALNRTMEGKGKLAV